MRDPEKKMQEEKGSWQRVKGRFSNRESRQSQKDSVPLQWGVLKKLKGAEETP